LHKIKLYILGLTVTATVFALGLFVIINNLMPDRTGNILLFYFVFGVLVFCLGVLAGFFLRRSFGQRELLNHYLALSARQGLWFAILLAVSLFLLSIGLFSWISGGLLVLTLVFLESYLLTKSNN